MTDLFISHSPIPSVELDENSPAGITTLSDGSSLKSLSSGSEQSLDRMGGGSFSSVMSEVDKKLKHVGFLIVEMIETESTYIHALDDVIDGYINRLRRDPASGFTEEVVSQVFVNIEEIRDFHDKLLKQLLQCENKHKLVAQLFIDYIHRFSDMYIGFCSAFPQSLAKLEQLHNTEPYKSALDQCQRELGHIFPVEEYLHRAVQRFLKYPLLFKDMAKKLMSLDGHDVVQEALDKLLVTAVKINSVKRVQELQSNELVGWKGGDLKTMGDLLLEDSFKVVGAKDPRYLFLFKDCVLITKKKETEGIFSFKESIAMNDITLKEQVDNDFLKWSLLIRKGAESFTVSAKDIEQKDRWIREVKRCIVYSTPGLTDTQKEAFLNKLPSLKHDVEHIDRIWKRAHKKSKKATKRTESVRILHNTDCESDTFSINSEISQAFEIESPTPSVTSNRSLSKEFDSRASVNGFNRRIPVKKRVVDDEDINPLDPDLVQVSKVPKTVSFDSPDGLEHKISDSFLDEEIDGPGNDNSDSFVHDVLNSVEIQKVENAKLAAEESKTVELNSRLESSELEVTVETFQPSEKISYPDSFDLKNDLSQIETEESNSVTEVLENAFNTLEATKPMLVPDKTTSEISEILETIPSISEPVDEVPEAILEISGTGLFFEEPLEEPLVQTVPPESVVSIIPFYEDTNDVDVNVSDKSDVTPDLAEDTLDPGTNDVDLNDSHKSDVTHDLAEDAFAGLKPEENENAELNTGVDGMLDWLIRQLFENQYYPGNLFALLYLSICVVSVLPYYITVPICAVIVLFIGYKHWTQNSLKLEKVD